MLPSRPDQSTPLSRVPQDLGREEALRLMREAGGDRVAVYGLENHAGTPVYVHAKVCVMDDCWATIGSDNFNLRSWTHDSELSAVVVDTEGGYHSAYARRLRLTLSSVTSRSRCSAASSKKPKWCGPWSVCQSRPP